MFDRELDYDGVASIHGIAEHESLAKTSLSFIELFGSKPNVWINKIKHHSFFLALEGGIYLGKLGYVLVRETYTILVLETLRKHFGLEIM